MRAAQEVIDGRLDGEFPLVVFQTGSGTQSNMNANEVIANRAIQLAGGVVGSMKPIHPNDDVNRSQSSNDTFPTAMHIATVEEVEDVLVPGGARAARYAGGQGRGVCRRRDGGPHAPPGRHAGDARPGDRELGGAARSGARRPSRARMPGVHELAIGGTAVGTGLNAPARFGDVAARLHRAGDRQAVRVGAEQVRRAVGARRDGQRQRRPADARRACCMKLANDVRWYA